MSLPMRERGWTRWPLKVPFNPNHSIIPQNQSHECLNNILNTNKAIPCSPGLRWGCSADDAPGWDLDRGLTFRPLNYNTQTFQQHGIDHQTSLENTLRSSDKKEQYKSYPLLTIPAFIEINGLFNYYRGQPYIFSTPKWFHKTRLYEICTLLTLVKPPH